ncbi:MAG: aromatic ring-hydroxylating dioxygenase subunit alpha [Betaproteobacteria bacterium]|nr:aromatic ring-hydroxylating dioxygenase subunit alpha [Betaproteobacteria bacterium]
MSGFVHDAWYVAAWSTELGAGMLARTILEQPVVLFRNTEGEPVALLDRCPHRLLPLSKGVLKGDTVQCGYHGLEFDCSGKCVRAPGQTRIPPEAKVRAFPVIEHMGMVWIWPGDPARASRDKLFDSLPQWALAQSGEATAGGCRWEVVSGPVMPVAGNYLLLSENLVDPAHVVYVHAASLGSAAMADIPIDTKQIGDTVLVSRWTPDAPASPILQRYGKWPGNVDRWQYYWLYPPHIAIVDFGAGPVGMGRGEEDRDAAVRLYSAHFMTPVDERNTLYFWFVLRNFAIGDKAVAADLLAQVTTTFMEDKVVLEAIQDAEDKPYAGTRVMLAIDSGSARLRRTVAKMVEKEQASAKAA